MKKLVAACLFAASSLPACQSPGEEFFLEGLRAQKGEGSGDPIDLFSKAISEDPKVARYYEVRGEAYEAKGDAKKALADLDKAIELSPRAYLYFERGYCRCDVGDVENATKDFADAIRQEPNNCQFYEGKALAEALGKHLDAALDSLDHAIACNAHGWRPKYLRGLVLTRMNRKDEAVAQFAATSGVSCGGSGKDIYFDGEREVQRSLSSSPLEPISATYWRTMQPDESYGRECK